MLPATINFKVLSNSLFTMCNFTQTCKKDLSEPDDQSFSLFHQDLHPQFFPQEFLHSATEKWAWL